VEHPLPYLALRLQVERLGKKNKMRTYALLGIILLVIGFFGLLNSYSISFGLSASGLFIIVYSLLTEKGKLESQVSETNITASKPQLATPIPSFCPDCGAKLEPKSLNCPSCGKRVGERT